MFFGRDGSPQKERQMREREGKLIDPLRNTASTVYK